MEMKASNTMTGNTRRVSLEFWRKFLCELIGGGRTLVPRLGNRIRGAVWVSAAISGPVRSGGVI